LKPAGCGVLGGRDTVVKACGSRVTEVCMQCHREHPLDSAPFCFQGDHTTEKQHANWGVTDQSDPLDFEAPEADVCDVCDGKIWGEALPAV